jgi:hypothetical protein
MENRKEKSKYQTNYAYTLKIKGQFESLDIVQEENVVDRDAIKLKIYEERWRTPEEAIEFLEKIIIIIKRDFIN